MYDKHSFIWYITFTAPKGNSNFQILLAKIFNHEKANQILPATKKGQIFSLKKKNSLMFLQTITSTFVKKLK